MHHRSINRSHCTIRVAYEFSQVLDCVELLQRPQSDIAQYILFGCKHTFIRHLVIQAQHVAGLLKQNGSKQLPALCP